MADSIIKPKLQLRAGGLANGDKTPSPATKLLISHGKPNFTIQRSPKAQQNGDSNPLTADLQNKNNNYYAYKSATVKVNATNNNSSSKDIIVQSTKFNGAFKPANVVNVDTMDGSSEEPFVTLRRTKKVEPVTKEGNEDDVPEFILRQRRIQERLAKDGLDFENRRSGYFTHVVMSPTNIEPKSYSETMSSPAVVPSLEMPARENEATIAEENENVEKPKVEVVQHEQKLEEVIEKEEKLEPVAHIEVAEEPSKVEESVTNGHVEEEEVAKAIEEVNKAVAGEIDDEKSIASEMEISASVEPEQSVEVEAAPVAAVVTSAIIEPEPQAHEEVKEEHVEKVTVHEEPKEEAKPVEKEEHHETIQQNGHSEESEAHEESAAPLTNGHNEAVTNGVDKAPQLPIPDPSGALGVNYEPKTVVSFSKDLGEPNKYPDTVVKEGSATNTAGATTAASEELQEMAKLKFDIKADEKDVQVTPVLRAE